MTYTTEEMANQKRWDELASVHKRSYGLERLLNGYSMLGQVETRELGDISHQELLHLQCHIGHDSLSLAMAGAKVTGVDFSESSVNIARDLAKQLNLKTEFLQGNVLDLKQITNKTYDIVFTSNGVLCWIRDIKLWAKNVANALKPGGFFYIYEYHPCAYIFDDCAEQALTPKYDYFLRQPWFFGEAGQDYADETYFSQNPTYEWLWPVSDIQNALISEGLQIEFFNEFDSATFKMLPFMMESTPGYWKLPEGMPSIPLMFSLKARKQIPT